MAASNTLFRSATLDPQVVEAIVREVLAQIESVSVPAEVPSAAGTWVVTAPVVTLRDLESRPAETTTVRVAKKAVITPAALDYVREKRLTLSREAVDATPLAAMAKAKNLQVTAQATDQLLVVKQCDSPAAEGVITQLERRKVPFAVESVNALLPAIERVLAPLCGSQRWACLLTVDVAAGVCLANRHAHVRAVSGSTTDELLAAAIAVGANLLIVDPARLGLFPTLRAVERYAGCEVVASPAVFGGH